MIRFALLFLIGALFGGSAVEVAHRSHDTQMLFNQKLKCQKLAASYADGKSIPSLGFSETIEYVDYSPSRNSCIAAVTDDASKARIYRVVDIVTNQWFWTDECLKAASGTSQPSSDVDCNNKEITMSKARQTAFQSVLRNSAQPLTTQ